MPHRDAFEITTLSGESLGSYTYAQFESEFGYDIVGRSQRQSSGSAQGREPKASGSKKKSSAGNSWNTASASGPISKSESIKTSSTPDLSSPSISRQPRRRWSPGDAERLERVAQSIGPEKALASFVETAGYDADDVRSRLEKLGFFRRERARAAAAERAVTKGDDEQIIFPVACVPWTKSEDRLLASGNGVKTREELHALFPERSAADVNARIIQLGIEPKPSGRRGPIGAQATHTTRKVSLAPANPTPRRGTKGLSGGSKPRPTTSSGSLGKWFPEEQDVLRAYYREKSIGKREMLERLTGRKISEIEREAIRLGYLDKPIEPPRKRGQGQSKKKRSVPKRSQTKRDQRPTSATGMRDWEKEVIRKNYPLYGTEFKLWSETLRGMRAVDVEKAAKAMGLKAPGNQSDSRRRKSKGNVGSSPARTTRREWSPAEVDIIRQNFETHGQGWSGWNELLPGVSWQEIEAEGRELFPPADALAALAKHFNAR